MAEARLRQEHPDTLQGLTLGAVRRREAGEPWAQDDDEGNNTSWRAERFC